MTDASQLALEFPHRPAHGREDFLISPNNEEAVAWVDRWPDWPAPALTVYGPAGCGKTHLAQVWRARSGAEVLDAAGIAAGDARPLPEGAASCIVDVKLGAAAPNGIDEAALLHLYNLVAEAGGHMLITSREAPARWNLALPDLASRLIAIPAVEIGPPDDALIGAVLVKLFHDRQLRVGEDVITFLLARMERSFAAVRAIVAALDRSALAAHRNITVPLARDVLRQFEQRGEREE